MYSDGLFLFGVTKGSLIPELKLTMKAIAFAYKYHQDEKRDDGSDYLSHPFACARSLLNYKIYDDEIIAAVILHDVRENQGVKHDIILKEFGEKVAKMVDLQTRKPGETIDGYINRVSEMIETILCKGVDRQHNSSTMINVYDIDRIERYIKETEDFVLPMLKKASLIYHEYSDALISIIDHINDVLVVAEAYARLYREKEKIKLK